MYLAIEVFNHIKYVEKIFIHCCHVEAAIQLLKVNIQLHTNSIATGYIMLHMNVHSSIKNAQRSMKLCTNIRARQLTRHKRFSSLWPRHALLWSAH